MNNPVKEQVYTTEITDDDVLLGRGIPISNYPGNIRFRRLVLERKEKYASSCRHQFKNDLALEIITIIKYQNGGRFVREVKTTAEANKLGITSSIKENKHWVIVDDRTILQKVKQALREPDPPKVLAQQLGPDFKVSEQIEQRKISYDLSLSDGSGTKEPTFGRKIFDNELRSDTQSTSTALGQPHISFLTETVSSSAKPFTSSQPIACFYELNSNSSKPIDYEQGLHRQPDRSVSRSKRAEHDAGSVFDRYEMDLKLYQDKQHIVNELARNVRSTSNTVLLDGINRPTAASFEYQQQQFAQQHLTKLLNQRHRSLSYPLLEDQIRHSLIDHQHPRDMKINDSQVPTRSMSDSLLSLHESTHRMAEARKQRDYFYELFQHDINGSCNRTRNQATISDGDLLSLLLKQQPAEQTHTSVVAQNPQALYHEPHTLGAIARLLSASEVEMRSENLISPVFGTSHGGPANVSGISACHPRDMISELFIRAIEESEPKSTSVAARKQNSALSSDDVLVHFTSSPTQPTFTIGSPSQDATPDRKRKANADISPDTKHASTYQRYL